MARAMAPEASLSVGEIQRKSYACSDTIRAFSARFTGIQAAVFMRIAGFIWGVGGVMLLLLSAVWRLTPRVLDLREYSLSGVQWLILAVFVLYMLYAEGYKGFHLNFAPRVVLRADHIRHHGRLWMVLLAPLICMGYLYATRRRQVVSIVLTLALILLIVGVSHISQPWRGIIDAGVVVGLTTGVASILWFVFRVLAGHQPAGMSADLPEKAGVSGLEHIAEE